jgi:hypothetical protein
LPSGTFEIKELNFKGEYISLHLATKHERTLGNIYSVYCVSSNDCPNLRDFRIDIAIARFGDSCLMIKDVQEFFNRMDAAVSKLDCYYRRGFMKYYDRKSINGKIDLFQKPNEFSYQREFRFYVHQEEDLPIKLNIGSLKDISEIVSMDAILTLELKHIE